MLSIRSRSTGELVFRDPQRRWPLPGRPRSPRSSGGTSSPALGVPRRALDEALADQRLRADLAPRVAAEVLEAGSSIRSVPRPVSSRDVDGGDRADPHAGDLHVLARDDEGGVVEDRAHAVARCPPSRRSRRSAATVAARRATRDCDAASHGPRDLATDRSRACRGRVDHGAAPSGGGWLAAPGQRRSWPLLEPLEPVLAARAAEHAPGGVVGDRERVEDRRMRA